MDGKTKRKTEFIMLDILEEMLEIQNRSYCTTVQMLVDDVKSEVRSLRKDVNPSSPGDTIWRTQLLAPYSGYPHMVSVRSCSESRIPPYGAPYFTAKSNHLQFDWLIFDNSKQFFDCLSVF